MTFSTAARVTQSNRNLYPGHAHSYLAQNKLSFPPEPELRCVDRVSPSFLPTLTEFWPTGLLPDSGLANFTLTSQPLPCATFLPSYHGGPGFHVSPLRAQLYPDSKEAPSHSSALIFLSDFVPLIKIKSQSMPDSQASRSAWLTEDNRLLDILIGYSGLMESTEQD